MRKPIARVWRARSRSRTISGTTTPHGPTWGSKDKHPGKSSLRCEQPLDQQHLADPPDLVAVLAVLLQLPVQRPPVDAQPFGTAALVAALQLVDVQHVAPLELLERDARRVEGREV